MLQRFLIVGCALALAACSHHGDRRSDGSMPSRDRGDARAREAREKGGVESGAPIGGTVTATSQPMTDLEFIREAALGGLTEVEAGRLAAERASDPEVKRFGQRMVADHSEANARLMTVATAQGVTPPAGLDARHREMTAKLAGLRGEAFDHEYIRMMVDDHVKDVASFERQAANASNAQVRAFAQRTLPTLRQHLDQVRQIAQRLGVANS